MVLEKSHFVHKVECSLHVDRGTEHMLDLGQRIATRASGVGSSSVHINHCYLHIQYV